MDPAQIRLAEEVEQRRELWDIRIPAYKLTAKRKDLIWDEVANAVNVTRDQAKHLWKNIKDYYRSVRSKLRSLPSGSAAVPLTPLQEQQQRYLSFLDCVIDAKATCTSLQGSQLPLPRPSPTARAEETVEGSSFDATFAAELAADASLADVARSPAAADRSAPEDGAASAPRTRPTGALKRAPKRRRAGNGSEDIVERVEATLEQLVADKSAHTGFLSELDVLLERMGPKKAFQFKVRVYSDAVGLAFDE